VITANTGDPGVHLVRVEHDSDCTWLAERRRKQRHQRQQWRRRSPRAHRPKDDDARRRPTPIADAQPGQPLVGKPTTPRRSSRPLSG
jgi:hypothetical protein